MFLVGPNGAGKSNFLDSLRFVADALNLSLDHAIRDRGGIDDVRRRSGGHPNHFSIRLDFDLTRRFQRTLRFPHRCLSRGRYKVQKEECVLRSTQHPTQEDYFYVENGTVTETSVEMVTGCCNGSALLGQRLRVTRISPCLRCVFPYGIL